MIDREIYETPASSAAQLIIQMTSARTDVFGPDVEDSHSQLLQGDPQSTGRGRGRSRGRGNVYQSASAALRSRGLGVTTVSRAGRQIRPTRRAGLSLFIRTRENSHWPSNIDETPQRPLGSRTRQLQPEPSDDVPAMPWESGTASPIPLFAPGDSDTDGEGEQGQLDMSNGSDNGSQELQYRKAQLHDSKIQRLTLSIIQHHPAMCQTTIFLWLEVSNRLTSVEGHKTNDRRAHYQHLAPILALKTLQCCCPLTTREWPCLQAEWPPNSKLRHQASRQLR